MQQDAISAFRKNLNDLEEIVMQAKRVPLSNMCMVDRERILGLANAITTDLPTVFAECEGVVQNQITIISEANERAEQTKQNATMRANQYVTDAKNQAQQMTAQAQQQAQEISRQMQQQSQRAGFEAVQGQLEQEVDNFLRQQGITPVQIRIDMMQQEDSIQMELLLTLEEKDRDREEWLRQNLQSSGLSLQIEYREGDVEDAGGL